MLQTRTQPLQIKDPVPSTICLLLKLPLTPTLSQLFQRVDPIIHPLPFQFCLLQLLFKFLTGLPQPPQRFRHRFLPHFQHLIETIFEVLRCFSHTFTESEGPPFLLNEDVFMYPSTFATSKPVLHLFGHFFQE